ncbi:MAG: transporter [Candidatus Latescibacterota bacterium]
MCGNEAALRLLLVAALLAPAAAQAGAWTLDAGQVWTKLAVQHQQTDRWFLASAAQAGGRLHGPGARRPYRFGGRYEASAWFLDVYGGLTGWLDLGIQVPYFWQRYADATRQGAAAAESGLGDVRVFTKVRLLARPLVLSLQAAAKLPTGEFTNREGAVPVGQGQWDFDLAGQVGRSFWPLPLYANLDAGRRFRTRNAGIDRDPGDEWFLSAEAGWDVTRRILLMGKVEGLFGAPSVDFGALSNRSEIRRILHATPVLSLSLRPGTRLEVGGRYALAGRNFPAGWQFVLGLSSLWGG